MRFNNIFVLPTVGFVSAAASLDSLPEAKKQGTVRLALCQILCGEDKKVNIANAGKAISEACSNGADLVILPECWNSPYDTSCFPVYAEPIPSAAREISAESPSTEFLVNAARYERTSFFLSLDGYVSSGVTNVDGSVISL
eukprot:526293-Amorphochlora_amoeboformis.AAC.1